MEVDFFPFEAFSDLAESLLALWRSLTSTRSSSDSPNLRNSRLRLRAFPHTITNLPVALLHGKNWFVNHLLTEIWRTTGSLPSASCQPTATLVMSGTTVKLVDNVEVEFDKAGELGEC